MGPPNVERTEITLRPCCIQQDSADQETRENKEQINATPRESAERDDVGDFGMIWQLEQRRCARTIRGKLPCPEYRPIQECEQTRLDRRNRFLVACLKSKAPAYSIFLDRFNLSRFRGGFFE